MFLILVAGASGCGKSTIINILQEYMLKKGLKTYGLSLDQFYKSLIPGDTTHNWDEPNAIDWELLVKIIKQMKENEGCVKIPHYDYITHQRIDNAENIIIEKDTIVIIEGIFTFCNEDLIKLGDLKLFIEADPINTCLIRRYKRDINERGRDGTSILKQYLSQVLPGYKKYIKSTKKYADIIYSNDYGDIPDESTPFIKMILTFLEKQ